MDDLYIRIEDLCKEKNVNITTMCTEANVSRATLTDYKMGRIKSLSADKLARIADYFDVSVDFLMGKTDIKKQPLSEDKEADVNDEFADIKFALYGGPKDLTDQDKKEILNFIKFIQHRRDEKNDKGGEVT